MNHVYTSPIESHHRHANQVNRIPQKALHIFSHRRTIAKTHEYNSQVRLLYKLDFVPLAGHEVSRIVSCVVAKHADETAYCTVYERK